MDKMAAQEPKDFNWEQLFRELDDIKELIVTAQKRVEDHFADDDRRFAELATSISRIYGGVAAGAVIIGTGITIALKFL